jgi:anti-sigma factor RsiW
VTCAEAAPVLSAYFDRELDVATSLGIEGHVRDCQRCSATLRNHDALRSSMSSASLVFAPPRDLEARIRRAGRREIMRQELRVQPWWQWSAASLAAVLAAALSWSIAANRAESPDQRALSELVASHVRSLMVDHLVDVESSDRHTVKPWFNGKVDFSPPVVDLASDGFPLVGGRLDYVGGRPVAVLVYRRRQHVLNLFIAPARSDEAEALRPLGAEGYHLARWSKGGLAFWAVSDGSAEDVEAFARQFDAAT